MLNDFTGADKVYIASGYTDLRKGIDGLARLVQQSSLNWIHLPTHYFCSADGGETESRACTGKRWLYPAIDKITPITTRSARNTLKTIHCTVEGKLLTDTAKKSLPLSFKGISTLPCR